MLLASFEHVRMGGTMLSMSDYSVLLTEAPTVVNRVTEGTAGTERVVAAHLAFMSLRGFTTALYYAPSLALDK